MLLRLPTSLPEVHACMAQGAVPIGGATLAWATWQRDGFPEQSMSLRNLPEANTLAPGELGAAVLLSEIDDRVPEVLHRAAASIGTGAVRRTATVGGNLVGSTLRCLLPAALVLDARAVTVESGATYETDLAEVIAKQHLLLRLMWHTPTASCFYKQPTGPGGPPPVVVAAAVHTVAHGRGVLRVAVRDGYDVVSEHTAHTADAGEALRALRQTEIGTLQEAAWTAVRREVTDLLDRVGRS
ncbi:FAD binding domain-containing protein [Streptomyces fructofermentans]|uniref:FAD binding domain-containing protein n=1 Tax=Streptomyces fructofermentans TaxID=152141 RepID=UPI0033D8C0C4